MYISLLDTWKKFTMNICYHSTSNSNPISDGSSTTFFVNVAEGTTTHLYMCATDEKAPFFGNQLKRKKKGKEVIDKGRIRKHLLS